MCVCVLEGGCWVIHSLRSLCSVVLTAAASVWEELSGSGEGVR